jgi:hypothetical protein
MYDSTRLKLNVEIKVTAKDQLIVRNIMEQVIKRIELVLWLECGMFTDTSIHGPNLEFFPAQGYIN